MSDARGVLVAAFCLFAWMGLGCGASDDGGAVDAGADSGVWWYVCFPEGAPLCGRDQELPLALSAQPDSWASTPLQSVGAWSFSVEDTQGQTGSPPVAQMLDATWISVTALEPSETDGESYPPRALVSFATAEGIGELRIALDAADLAHIPAAEPLELTLLHGLEVARGGDGTLLFALVDTRDWDTNPPLHPAPRTFPGAGLTVSLHPAPYCFGAEGVPQGNRQFGFDSLVVMGGGTERIIEPGASAEITTSVGTYRVHYVAGWHRAGECAQYADENPWRISYEILLVE